YREDGQARGRQFKVSRRSRSGMTRAASTRYLPSQVPVPSVCPDMRCEMYRVLTRLLVGGTLLIPAVASLLLTGAVVQPARSETPAAGTVTKRSIRGKCGMCHADIAEE